MSKYSVGLYEENRSSHLEVWAERDRTISCQVWCHLIDVTSLTWVLRQRLFPRVHIYHSSYPALSLDICIFSSVGLHPSLSCTLLFSLDWLIDFCLSTSLVFLLSRSQCCIYNSSQANRYHQRIGVGWVCQFFEGYYSNDRGDVAEALGDSLLPLCCRCLW